jgi:hypothetical protein
MLVSCDEEHHALWPPVVPEVVSEATDCADGPGKSGRDLSVSSSTSSKT